MHAFEIACRSRTFDSAGSPGMDTRTDRHDMRVLDRFTNPYFADVVVAFLRERGIAASLERSPWADQESAARRDTSVTHVLVSAAEFDEARRLLDRLRTHGQAGAPRAARGDTCTRLSRAADEEDTTMTDDRAAAAMKRMRDEIRGWQTRLDQLRVKGSLARLETMERCRELLDEFDRAYLRAKDQLAGWSSAGDREWSAVAAALEEGWRAARETWQNVRARSHTPHEDR